ncbi:MAG: L-threonylcarbamoyladenylate synthase [Arachnia sp.]
MSKSRTFTLDDKRDEAIAAAVAAIAEGQCVVVPTDTVYGIAADAFSAEAVQRLLEAKERGQDMPPPVLLAEPSMLRAIAWRAPEDAHKLAAAFWPGGLTLILGSQKASRLELGDTGGTVALRVPDCETTRALLRRTGPLAVSSANISGRAAATTCAEAHNQLGDRVSVYLDGGTTAGGQASTIVDFTRSATGRVVRAGVITAEQLAEVAPAIEV